MNRCILYRMENCPLWECMSEVLAGLQDIATLDDKEREHLRSRLYDAVYLLLKEAGDNGFYGNLWHDYLTGVLVSHENSYSIACELRGEAQGSINDAALYDIRIFRELFNADLTRAAQELDVPELSIILDYKPTGLGSRLFNTRIRDRICTLAREFEEAQDAAGMKALLTQFYKEYGVGMFGLHKAFRIEHDEAGALAGETQIVPVKNILHVYMKDLVGYEIAKKKLIENTEAFVEGRPANNCLLYGEAGTGKSSSIKAIANEYYDRGLRIIEVSRYQFRDLNHVIERIKNRNYRFILYMDDLSFEDNETEYKYLKAVIEGGLEKKPSNVLIYATSNRRHLVRESFHDRDGVEISDKHGGDTVQEKLSLASRFGVSIYYGAPTFEEYHAIVRELAERAGIRMEERELSKLATQWEMQHGGLSGRTAQQFIDHLLGAAGEKTVQAQQ